MSLVLALVALLLHGALLLLAAPTLAGLLEAGRARLAGRAGPPLAQPWRDVARLLRKQPVLAEQTSFLTPGGIYASAAATGAAALLVPSFALGMLAAPAADLFVLAGLLALARIAAALASLDLGTAGDGAEAAGAGLGAVLAELVLVLVALSVALATGGTNLDRAAAAIRDGQGTPIALALAGVATAMVALADAGSRYGAGPPDLAELSGRLLALAQLAGQLRVLVWLGLLAALFLPFGLAAEGAGPLGWLVGLLAWAGKIAVLACAWLLAEAARARLPAPGRFRFLGAALLLVLLAALVMLAGQRTA